MYLIKSSGKTGGQNNSKEADNMILKKNSLMNLQTSLIDLKISCKRATLGWAKMHEVFKSLLPRYFLKDIYVK